MQKRIKIEDKELDFVFEVVNVQFNQLGQYQLVLTLKNPLQEGSVSGVRLRVEDGDVLEDSSICTETIEQKSLDEVYTVTHNKFVFSLPKGFCKNDKNHDVRLKVEAIRMTDSRVKAGEGFFAIYPRTNTPRINLFAGPDEELYCYSGLMALLRVQNDYLAMHCGRLLYTVAFHQARPVVLNAGKSLQEEEKPVEQFTSWDCDLCVNSSEGSFKEEIRGAVSQNFPTLQEPGEEMSINVQSRKDVNLGHPDPDLKDNMNLNNPDPDSKAKSHDSIESPPISQSEIQSPTKPPSNINDSLMRNQLILPLDVTSSDSPEPLLYTHVTESPLPREGPAHCPLLPDSHVSHPGAETLSIILHGATSLPPLSDGGIPLPFVIVRSGVEGPCDLKSHAETHCPAQPTYSPSWEERLSVELQDRQTSGNDITISVADGRTKELLAHYQLPVSQLQPFHHYHLELVQRHRAAPSGTRLYVTMVRKLSVLPRQPCFSFTAFEVLLQRMDGPLREPVGPLLAVARIVADYEFYRGNMLLRVPRAAGICVNSILLPEPSDCDFTAPPLTVHGWPQVSLPGFPEELPVWNHCFLFLGRDCATIFTEGAALVLEFYLTTTVMNMGGWRIQNPVAFSALILDQSLYWQLTSQRGLKVPRLPLQGSSFLTTSETPPTVSLVIRLIGSESPDFTLTEVDCSVLPCLDQEIQNKETSCPTDDQSPNPHPEAEHTEPPPSPLFSEGHTLPRPALERDAYDLPSHDALAKILPEYLHLLKKPKGQTKTSEKKPNSLLNQTFDVHSSHKSLQIPDSDDDPHATVVTEHQTQELENYRTAMHKMADDIIALRSQVSSLETENSQLRRDLSQRQDLSHTLLDDTDIDVMTKAEIADRIASLKFKLASESSQAAAQKDRIQQLQNELIRKNDVEKEFVQLQRAHQQQQAVLNRFQTRVSKITALEDTVRQQDKVIEKMEKILGAKLKERNEENLKKKTAIKHKDEIEMKRREIESVLAAENSRLREELDRFRNQPPPVIIHQPAQVHQSFSDSEKLKLLTQLARAEGRSETLEQQLREISKQWGREKQEMLSRLSEYEHGFVRTSTMIFHDLPVKGVTDSVLGRVRHRQLDPLK